MPAHPLVLIGLDLDVEQILEASGLSADFAVKCGLFQLKKGLFCIYALGGFFF